MSEEKSDKCGFVSIHYIICECGKTFPSEEALKTHLELEHPHKRERKEYKCGICSQVYNSEDDCIKHYEESHMAAETNQGNYEAEDTDEFDADIKCGTEEGEIPYLEEEEIPPENVPLEEAIEAIKQETIEEGEISLEEDGIPILFEMPRVPAPKRQQKIISKTKMCPELMFLIQEGENQGEVVPMLKKSGRLPNKNQRNIVCEVCGKYYASAAALRYHQRSHTGERPYCCTICPKKFAMPLFLQIHIRTHTGERPYQCSACPKAFSNKAALLRHDRVHTGEKPYKCPMCAKSFTQSNSMKLHVTTVHLKQPTPYKSRHRKQLAAERSQNKKTVFINPRKKVATEIDSVEVLKNGLESYVLGPLKADLVNLKADIDMLSQADIEVDLNDTEALEVVKDEDVYQIKENVIYEMKDNNNVYELIEEVLYDEENDQYEVVCGD